MRLQCRYLQRSVRALRGLRWHPNGETASRCLRCRSAKEETGVVGCHPQVAGPPLPKRTVDSHHGNHVISDTLNDPEAFQGGSVPQAHATCCKDREFDLQDNVKSSNGYSIRHTDAVDPSKAFWHTSFVST